MHKFKKEEFEEAVRTSYSIRSVLQKLGLTPAGGNYLCFKSYAEKYNIDYSHFTGKGHLIGKTHTWSTKPLSEILVYGKVENTHRLRIRLIKEGVKQDKCESCGNVMWLGKPISLELHHLDGDRKNNILSNLIIICPNCHAQTDNYRRNKSK